MGNDCSKLCSKSDQKSKQSSRRPTLARNNQSSSCASLHSSHRDTINSFSLENYLKVQDLATKGNSEMVKKYLQEGFLVDFPLDQSGWTLLHLACQSANPVLFETVLNFHPYVDAQETAEGWTPLMICAINNLYKFGNLLIKNNADPTLLDNSGKNAKQLAEKYRSNDFLEHCKI